MINPESQTPPPTSAPAPADAPPTVPCAPVRTGIFPPSTMKPFYWLVVFTVRLFSRLWCRLEVVNVERVPRQGPVLVLPTHTSFFDPPMVGAHLPREAHYLSREGILKVPLLGLACRHLNAHPIRRGASDREAIRTCRQILRDGHPLIFFPEGTRSKTGTLGPLQRGFAMILDGMTDVPYVPVIAQDTYRVLHKGQIFPRPRKIRLLYGEPAYLPTRREGESTRDYFDRCAQDLERRLRELGAR